MNAPDEKTSDTAFQERRKDYPSLLREFQFLEMRINEAIDLKKSLLSEQLQLRKDLNAHIQETKAMTEAWKHGAWAIKVIRFAATVTVSVITAWITVTTFLQGK